MVINVLYVLLTFAREQRTDVKFQCYEHQRAPIASCTLSRFARKASGWAVRILPHTSPYYMFQQKTEDFRLGLFLLNTAY